MMKYIDVRSLAPLLLAFAALTGCSTAPKEEDQVVFLLKARSATRWFESSVPGLAGQIDNAAGFVVFPDIHQWGILLGGGKYGRGAVCKADGTQIGWAAINTGSVGLQAGIQGFKLLMVVKDEWTLNKFKQNELTGSASGVLVAADEGVSGTAPFENGIALYEGANEGLMAGVNIGLNYLKYQPLSSSEKPGDVR